MNKQIVIFLSNVSFGYEKTCILKNVNLDIYAKEFVGVFGPNGGGKTTFLKLLMGFLKPSQGNILILGEEATTARKKVGYVPQFATADKQFPISCLEVVLMGLLSKISPWGTYSKELQDKAEKSLEKVGLSAYRDVSFGKLSGGQTQRLLIARALVSSPDILLLDEPTTSLDPEAEQEIYRLLLELKKTMTIVMVTHHLHAATKQADRLLCVNKEISSLLPKDVCEHFALGLYHPPLIKGED